MSDDELLSPFDEEVLHAVADDSRIEVQALRETVADHQRTMRETPGVEDLVYEWRKQYDDPVVARTASLFIVAVPPTVWEEYGDYLDIDTPMLRALTAVHQEQTVRTPEATLDGMPDGHTTLVVGRE